MQSLNLMRLACRTWPKFNRFYSKGVQREYTVSPFCDINVLLSYATDLKPLDFNKYPDSNKVLIECDREIECNQIGDTINITSPGVPFEEKIKCCIRAPLKSKLNVTSAGSIDITDFQGKAIRLFSENGNVNIGPCKNDVLAVRANNGDIVLKDSIEAQKITLKTLNYGNISANKLKCLGLHLETDDGTVNTESAYCDESYFVTKRGTLNLYNVHKLSKVSISEHGTLNMIGFDGTLEVSLQSGSADIQISRIINYSHVVIRGEGKLNLSLSESVLAETQIEIKSKLCTVEDGLVYEENEDTDDVTFKPKSFKEHLKLIVNCPDCVVDVKLASWADTITKRVTESNVQAS